MKLMIQKIKTSLSRAVYFALLIFTCFCFFAISSYDPKDPSVNSIIYPPEPIKNICGEVGAQISGFMIYHFGAGSILMAIMASFFFVVGLLKGRSTKRLLEALTSTTLLFLSLSWFLQIFLPSISLEGFSVSLLGSLGIKSQKMFFFPLGTIGASLLALFLFVSGAFLAVRSFK